MSHQPLLHWRPSRSTPVTGRAALLLLTAIASCAAAHGQAIHAQHRIEAGLGSLANFAKDDLAAPVRYIGHGAPISAGYAFRSDKSRHIAGLSFSRTGFVAQPLDRDDDAAFGEADFLLIRWHYAYLRTPTRRLPSGLSLWIGPEWHTTAHVREYFYTPEHSEITWEVFSSIGLRFQADYALARGVAGIRLSLPVLAYVNRPPYSIEGDDVFYALFNRSAFLKLGRLASWGRLSAFQAGLTYDHPVTQAIGARAGYYLSMYRYRAPLRTAAALREFRLDLYVTLSRP